MQCLDADDTDDPAENIGLLEINVDQFSGAILNMLDGFPNVADS